jgi:hypothetical protein
LRLYKASEEKHEKNFNQNIRTLDQYFNRDSKIQGHSATNFAAKFGVLESCVSE